MRKVNVLAMLIIWGGMAGCIRLAGSAGYWKQGAEDKIPEIHEAGFDTANLLPAKTDSK